MNKQLIAARFGKAIASYDREAVVQQQIARKMVYLLERYITPLCGKVIEVGCGTGVFSRLFLRSFQPEELLLNDICSGMESVLADFLTDNIRFCAGDAEYFDLPEMQDLIVSCSAIQWFASPELFFDRCYCSLSKNGYLAFSTFGCDNMKEVTFLTGNSLPYRSRLELESALSVNYQLLCSKEETITLNFHSPLEVLHHLKRTGVTAVAGQSWTKGDLVSFCHRYSEAFANGRTVSLTYHPIYIIAKKKER